MATPITATTETENFASNAVGIFSVFIDPQAASRQVFYRWCWVVPIVLISIVSVVQSLMILPAVEHVLLTNPPLGVTAEAIPKIVGLQRTFSYFAPLGVVIFLLIGAMLMFAASSVMQVKATFGNIFNLVAMSSLIKLLDSITSLIIVRAKGDDVASMAALHPSVGPDLFVTDSTNKALAALMNFFSIPTVWAFVMTALTFSFAFKVSKGKAFAVTSAYWLVFLIFAVVGGLLGR